MSGLFGSAVTTLFWRRGFFGLAPVTVVSNSLLLTAGLNGNPCCHCPCGPGGRFGFDDGQTGVVLGTLVPTLIAGHTITFLTQGFSSVSGFTQLTLALIPDNLPQNIFTSLEITDSLVGDVTFTSAAATYFASATTGLGPHFTAWQWNAPAQLFSNGGTYHIVPA